MASRLSPPSSPPPKMDTNNDDNDNNNDDHVLPNTFNVAVAIAKKERAKQKQQQQQEQEQQLKQREQDNSKQQLPRSSLRDFINGASLYLACIALPTLIGLTGLMDSTTQETTSGENFPEEQQQEESYYEQVSSYLCEYLSSYFCLDEDGQDETSTMTVPVHAPDAEWTDVGIVACLSLSMAAIRLVLVHWLVPRSLAPNNKRLEAIVRCKSVHLLSSSYPKSLTPQGSKRNLNVTEEYSQEFPPMPLLFSSEETTSSSENTTRQQQQQETTSGEQQQPDDSTGRHRNVRQSFGSLWSTGRRSARRVLGVEPRAPYKGDELHDSDQLFTAPRYATAVFRLFYCLGSCACAYLWLRHASFWPPAMGGHGDTKNCWDLKGGVALETTTDFDHSNQVLRKYFLVQASYHLHSWATHCMSIMALWWYGTSLIAIRKSMASYWRALLQHLLALAMIGGCYFFSSLRRLGAIGIFALDVSSMFVHLLQLCINAPPGTLWNKPGVIAAIHRGLVIPIFLYTRFYIFPFVVYHSAINESADWLRQMERTMFPGTAKAMTTIFHAFLAANVMLNLIAFQRLLFHPHLQSVTTRSATDKQQ